MHDSKIGTEELSLLALLQWALFMIELTKSKSLTCGLVYSFKCAFICLAHEWNPNKVKMSLTTQLHFGFDNLSQLLSSRRIQKGQAIGLC